jgi:cytochrome c
MRSKISGALILSLGFATSAFAQHAGKDIFTSKCAICHAADGSGKTSIGKSAKVRDFHSPEFQKQSDEDLKASNDQQRQR